jgi:hypothetical protein
MMRGLREDVEASESEEAIAARKKKEDEEEAAKHRAMDARRVLYTGSHTTALAW